MRNFSSRVAKLFAVSAFNFASQAQLIGEKNGLL